MASPRPHQTPEDEKIGGNHGSIFGGGPEATFVFLCRRSGPCNCLGLATPHPEESMHATLQHTVDSARGGATLPKRWALPASQEGARQLERPQVGVQKTTVVFPTQLR